MKRRNRSIWEANIWEANSYKSDVFKKPSISHDISSEHVSRPSTLRPNNLKSQIKIRTTPTSTATWPTSTATWPTESEHVSQSNVKYNQSGWPSPDAEDRPSTLGERALQTEPNAHQGNVEVVGEHQRSYHRQLCLQTRSPLPSSSPPK